MRNLIFHRVSYWRSAVRRFSSVSGGSEAVGSKKNQNRMSGWQIHSYSENVADMQFTQNLKKPYIKKPSQLLVKIHASSVNPIDVAMMGKRLIIQLRMRSNGFHSRRLRLNAPEYNA
jgi:hypothetical protein